MIAPLTHRAAVVPPGAALSSGLAGPPPARFSRPALALSFLSLTLVLLPGAVPPARAQTPFSFGVNFAAHRLPELGQTRAGYGLLLNYFAYEPFVSLEAAVNFFPTASGGNLGETQAFFGPNFGKKIGHWGGFIKLHPGLTHFGGGALPARLTEHTHLAVDLGGVVTYRIAPAISLRGDVSDVSIHYGSARLLAGPGRPVGPQLGTRNTLQANIGILVNF